MAIPKPVHDEYLELLRAFKATRPQAAEFHGVDLMKSTSGQRGILNFLSKAFALGCLPVWSAAEKRFCVACRIVETFLDPGLNRWASWLPTGANTDRQNIAHIFYALPDPLLKEFLDAYRQPTVEGLRQSVRSLRGALMLKNVPLLLETLTGAVLSMGRIVNAEAGQDGFIAGKHFIGISINFPVFVQFMSHADRLLRDVGAGHVQVVHDETSEFEAAFKWAFDTYAAAKSESYFRLQNGQDVYFGLSRLKTFRTGKSVQELEIQGADLLAAALRGVFISLGTEKPMSVEVEKMARLIFDQRPASKDGNFWVMASERVWNRFAQLYGPQQPFARTA